MKYLLPIMLFLTGCTSTLPVIIPDITEDNAVMLDIKDRIANPGAATPSYGWVFWYAPLAIITLIWAYREFIKKPIKPERKMKKANQVKKKK